MTETMTAGSLALVLLLVYLSVHIIWWTLAPKEERRPLITVVLLVVFLIWVYGVPIIVTRRG